MVRRCIIAHGRRVAEADPADLVTLAAMRDVLDEAIVAAVKGLRERHSWAEIAEALGVTRQAAWERYGP